MTILRGILEVGKRVDYVLSAGIPGRGGIFTVLNPATDTRFTYKVQLSDDSKVKFVKFLAGPDNTRSYRYLGIFNQDNQFRMTRASKCSPDAPVARAFTWFVTHMESPLIEVWQEGICGRCGRKLTVPSSVAAGLGPECAGKI